MSCTCSAITNRLLGLILAKVDHQTEALDMLLLESARLNPEAVARARAILERAKRSGDRPKLRVLTNPGQASPAAHPD